MCELCTPEPKERNFEDFFRISRSPRAPKNPLFSPPRHSWELGTGQASESTWTGSDPFCLIKIIIRFFEVPLKTFRANLSGRIYRWFSLKKIIQTSLFLDLKATLKFFVTVWFSNIFFSSKKIWAWSSRKHCYWGIPDFRKILRMHHGFPMFPDD